MVSPDTVRVAAIGWGTDVTIAATTNGVSGTAELHLLDQIAFAGDHLDADASVYLMDPDGSNPVRLTDTASRDFSPVWRPRP